MKSMITAALALALTSGVALADDKPSADENKKIGEVLTEMGFSGGEYERESGGIAAFEVDDAKDKNGREFDIKLDKDFNVLSVTAD